MAPEIRRYKDIVLNPCNRSADRRNIAAIRDALEALANVQEEPEEGGSGGTGDQIIFFEVQSDAVGQPSVAVKQVSYDAGAESWAVTDVDYTAYDWTPSQRFRANFETGAYGIGRINTEIATDALEVLSLEGKARFLQGVLDENMGATTTKQGRVNVSHFWGDAPNGRNPGTPLIVHDHVNMAPNAKLGDTVLAAWDEKRQQYVLIGPWNGNKDPGQAAIVRTDAGDETKGCDTSVEDTDFCLYSGRVQTISVAADWCEDKFDDGAPIWIVDGRNCHGTPRLGHQERYVAVSMGISYDPDPEGPNTDERGLYAIVDYSPSFRWFKILTDIESLVTESISDINDLVCRVHDCNGDQPDDAPSAWGRWTDVDPCTRELKTIEQEPVLVYFPRYRSRCKPSNDQTFKERCQSVDSNPDCRKNEYILAYWNPIAERWDAVMDSEKCVQQQEVAKVTICDQINKCCVYPGIKSFFWPNEDGYCAPETDREEVWILCNNGDQELPPGFCEIGVKICDAFECILPDPDEPDTKTISVVRPVYLIQCGPCSPCACPDTTKPIYFKIKASNSDNGCGFLDGISGELHCHLGNPFVLSPGNDQCWQGHFSVDGLMPRLAFSIDHEDSPTGIYYIEVAFPGQSATAGTILNVYEEEIGGGLPLDNPQPIPMPDVTKFGSDLLGCQAITIQDPSEYGRYVLQYRPRRYAYGLRAVCSEGSQGLTGVQIYVLKDNYTTVPYNKSGVCGTGSATKISSSDWVIAGPQNLGDNGALEPCCDNWQRGCLDDPFFGCNSNGIDDFAVKFGAVDGPRLSSCPHYANTHIMGGCRCFHPNDTSGVGVNVCGSTVGGCDEDGEPDRAQQGCCSHPANQICFEFDWPEVQQIPG